MTVKKAATVVIEEGEEPQPWDGSCGHEVKCFKCSGMVNHNGCADDGCPVAAQAKRQKI